MLAVEPLVIFYWRWEEAIPWAEQQLSKAGFKPLRTFDLKVARAGQEACACPHHGTEQCDCQMVVLLVYGKYTQPLCLIIQGYDEITCLYVVNTPQQRADPCLLSLLQHELLLMDLPLPNDEPVDPEKTDLHLHCEGIQVLKS